MKPFFFPRFGVLALLLALIFTPGCDSSDPHSDGEGDVVILFDHVVGNDVVSLGTLQYTNAAGNLYAISRIQYYISGIILHAEDGTEVPFDNVHLIDFEDTATYQMTLKDVPGGEYSEISFTVGLTADKNLTGALPNTSANNNMIWPEEMGGGYHHMKVEGSWERGDGSLGSYNLHLGLNNSGTVDRLEFHGGHLHVDGEGEIKMVADMNEFFTQPFTIDLAAFPMMIMGNQEAQQNISVNVLSAFEAHGHE